MHHFLRKETETAMLFTSFAFVAFAAFTALLYFVVPRRIQWCVLLLASYLFYLFAGWEYIFFLVYTTVVSYVTARIMQKRADDEDAYIASMREQMDKSARKAYRAKEKRRRFRILLVGLFLGFGVLAIIKYTAFAAESVNSVLSLFTDAEITVPSLLLPLGISFYTFQSMGYLIDVYRKKARAEQNLAKFALFVSFFPQIVQGPISRFGDLSEQLLAERKFDSMAFRQGLLRVCWGYFKKIVVADTAMIAVKELISSPDEYRGVYVLMLILLYSAQIYGDFTGGIDITVGYAELLGIRIAENFKRPLSSKTVDEYWNRWHITMGTWFKDYVFYPLSISRPMQKLSTWSRGKSVAVGKRLPVYIATLATWFLTGLWHGAGWNFIVWGLLNGIVILISNELSPLWRRFGNRFPRLCASWGWNLWRMARTFLLMGLIRSLDCYRDVGTTFRLWGSMLTDWNWGELFTGGLCSFGLGVAEWGVIAGGVAMICIVSHLGREVPLRERIAKRPVAVCAAVCLLILLIAVFGAYGIGYDSSQFIYNQF
ncbi:MAG: MBOAT family protein [Clostridia bacterium]|nr:MBOAT family protein [Clostridia bacterium]